MAGCAKSHFGVADKAMILPPDVAQTEEAIADAEKSDGATHCPDKIAEAKDLAKQAMETYWACHTHKGDEYACPGQEPGERGEDMSTAARTDPAAAGCSRTGCGPTGKATRQLPLGEFRF